MGNDSFNTEADKRYKSIGNLLITVTIISFVCLLFAFIMGFDWVTEQVNVAAFVSEIALQSVFLAIFLIILAAFILGTPKYLFLSVSNEKVKLNLYLYFYYFGTFIQTLSYFIIGLPIAALLIEKTFFTESDIFVILMTSLCAFLIIDTLFINATGWIERNFDKIVHKFIKSEGNILEDPEEGLNNTYKLEKVYSIIATITTILVIGDAASAVAYPLEITKETNRLQAYLDSTSYIYMMIFVSTTLVYLKQLVKEGIKK